MLQYIPADLAGSEKGTATGHKGARFREGANINKSLLGLNTTSFFKKNRFPILGKCLIKYATISC